MSTFTQSIKQARQSLKLPVREVANAMRIDPALLSRYENGQRKPTRQQVLKMAHLLKLDEEQLIVQWLADRIVYQLRDEDLALKAMMVAEEEIRWHRESHEVPVQDSLKPLLEEAENLKAQLDKLRKMDSYRIAEALELEYTFESNRIEGNTLTLQETDLVVNEGLTISGKSMREHLEAINHTDALAFVKEMVQKKLPINERNVLQLHQLVLRGIDRENAGTYRRVQVMIKGSKHTPPAPFLVPKQMEDYFVWYETNKRRLHPLVLAAEMHERLVTIHPFIDGNGRTSRLVMNLILLAHGYPIANLKGDNDSRMAYYKALEKVQAEGDKADFIELIAQTEVAALSRYLSILKGE